MNQKAKNWNLYIFEENEKNCSENFFGGANKDTRNTSRGQIRHETKTVNLGQQAVFKSKYISDVLCS